MKALNKTWGYRVAGRRLELLDVHGAVLAELQERSLYFGCSSAGNSTSIETPVRLAHARPHRSAVAVASSEVA